MVVCLGLGVLLWAVLGAVPGARSWEISANGYLLGLVIAGGLIGLVAPGPHMRTGLLLVAPGAATLVAASPGDHPDAVWWMLTLLLGACFAAGSHRLAVELRRWLLSHRSGTPRAGGIQ